MAATGAVVLGICGGYEMLGSGIDDIVESRAGSVPGLGLLDVSTVFGEDKVLAQRRGEAFGFGVCGYQIHHGRVRPDSHAASSCWLTLDGQPDGYRTGRVMGTTLHGLFDSDGFRHAFLDYVAGLRGTRFQAEPMPFRERREAELDRLADCLEEHLAVGRVLELMGLAA